MRRTTPARRDAAGSRHLSMPPAGLHGQALRDINLVARAGEVVGIAGRCRQRAERAVRGALRRAPGGPAGRRRRSPAGRAGTAGIDARRRLGAAFVPEERLGHAAAPTHRLSENTLISHAAAEVSRSGFILLERRQAPRPLDRPELRRAHAGRRPAGAQALRRQPAEIRDRPRDHPQAEAARRRPADLGRRCRRGAPDPSGSRRSRPSRAAPSWSISQDLDELFEMADRMAVIHHGRLEPAQAHRRMDQGGRGPRNARRRASLRRRPCGLS